MKVLIAPTAFKGSITAIQAAHLIAQGLQEGFPGICTTLLPVADGGDGTVETLVEATKGKFIQKTVCGPLGKAVQAQYGILGDGKTAIIEMAKASGLALLPLDARNPMLTDTYGTGELIVDAIEQGITKIILGIGGSATIDGGVGLAQALGIRFLDYQNREIPKGVHALYNCYEIDSTKIHPKLNEVFFEIACDVNNPLLGPQGAAQVYGPQKGASSHMITTIERALENYVKILETKCQKPLANIPGVGAGGGIILPLLAFCNTKICSGCELILQACSFEDKLSGCELVITGEGCLDAQSLAGKATIGVARIAKKHNIPVIALCGSIGTEAELTNQQGILAFFSCLTTSVHERELSEKAPHMLKSIACQLGHVLRWKVAGLK